MQSTDTLIKFAFPWASGALAADVSVVPLTTTLAGRASLTTGFPPENFIPVGSGGVPPYGADQNGIIQQLTAWSRWLSGGGPLPFDATFAAASGGYPKGALIASGDLTHAWLSTIEENVANPDTGGAGWTEVLYSSYVAVHQGGGIGQLANQVFIGWSGAYGLKVTVDATDLGSVSFQADTYARDAATLASAYTADAVVAAETQVSHDGGKANFWGGFQLRMGYGITTTGVGDIVNFETPFPSMCLGVIVNEQAAQPNWATNGGPSVYGTSNQQKTGFQVSCVTWEQSTHTWSPAGGYGYYYLAWGY